MSVQEDVCAIFPITKLFDQQLNLPLGMQLQALEALLPVEDGEVENTVDYLTIYNETELPSETE